jgi:hypothetical protein
MAAPKGIFWIHIKKSGGTSTRQVFSSLYRETDRSKRPQCFIQADPAEYNDILNNYRVPLGDYQFRRCLFAKKFLYGDDWGRLVKFGFSRNPVDRCVSQFFYLYYRENTKAFLRRRLKMAASFQVGRGIGWNFDRFLDMLEEGRRSDSNLAPHGLHFRTHTAAMWDDVTDEDGNILLDYIFRLDDYRPGLNHILDIFGMKRLAETDVVHLNKSKRAAFKPAAAQLARIEELFAGDFEIYEKHAFRDFG